MIIRLGAAIMAAMLLGAATLAAPNGQGSADNAPAKQRQSDRTAYQRQNQTTQPPLRVEVVDSKEQAESRRTRSDEARQDQAEDRANQQLASRLSLVQAFFAFLATILLFLTLIYTARSANAAKNAAQTAREAITQTVEAVVAATRSADAAEHALRLSTDQFSANMRPYIAINYAAEP